MKGLVFKSTGSWYEIRTDEGKVFRCRLRGKIKLDQSKTTNPIAVGDEVDFDPDGSAEGIISEIRPRRNYVIRKSVHKTGHGHILAANVDQAIVIATISYPRTSLGFIDRFLVSCESFEIPATIIFNKADLWEKDDQDYFEQLNDVYPELGYELYSISAITGEGIDLIIDRLSQKVSLVAGHSGVGKSTFLNKLSENIDQNIGDVSEANLKGRHTTTFAEMFEVEPNTFLIDTPGIKELGLMDMEAWEISHYFPEMRELFNSCKFHNCLHINEPGCKVIEAFAEGFIHESRFASYLSMLEDDDNRR